MESFQVRDFNDPKRKPSLNSVLAQKERLKVAERVRLGETVETSPENKAIADVDLEAIEPQYTPLEEQIMAENKAMSLVGHLGELRKRIIISAIAILVGFCVAYYYVDDILAIIIAPAGKLYYMRPTEAFFTYMKVALVAGLIAASPIWLYEVWAFVIPALTKQEKQLTNWFLPLLLYYLLWEFYSLMRWYYPWRFNFLLALLPMNCNPYFPLVNILILSLPLFCRLV